MASWQLTCLNCEREFTHSVIANNLDNYYLPIKPDFPEDGMEFRCPHCGNKSTYQRTDLTFKL
jgi:DNA-directed RNA polymerase subunit RPC12/RpoP